MTCCAPSVEFPDAMIDRRRATNDELLLASHDLGTGLRQTDLSVPTIHCGRPHGGVDRFLRPLSFFRDLFKA